MADEYEYEDDFGDGDCDGDEKDDEDVNAHLSVVALARHEARSWGMVRQHEVRCSGWASRIVSLCGVACYASVSVSVGVHRRMHGHVHVEITYQGISGLAHFGSFDGWPSECDCWEIWDVALQDLYKRSEAFRRDCSFNPARHFPDWPN